MKVPTALSFTSILKQPLNSGHPATPYNGQISRSQLYASNTQRPRFSGHSLTFSTRLSSGVARTSQLLGHSMAGHTTFVQTFTRSAEAYSGIWGHPPPPENLGILQPPKLVLRPYTVAKCKLLTANSRMISL